MNDRTLLAKLAGILGGKSQTDTPSVVPTTPDEPLAEGDDEDTPEIIFDDGEVPTAAAALPAFGERQTVDAVALCDLLLAELSKEPGFPKTGVTVTVYGHNPWNAMLVFAHSSATPAVAARLRLALTDIVSRMRRQFDVAVSKA